MPTSHRFQLHRLKIVSNNLKKLVGGIFTFNLPFIHVYNLVHLLFGISVLQRSYDSSKGTNNHFCDLDSSYNAFPMQVHVQILVPSFDIG